MYTTRTILIFCLISNFYRRCFGDAGESTIDNGYLEFKKKGISFDYPNLNGHLHGAVKDSSVSSNNHLRYFSPLSANNYGSRYGQFPQKSMYGPFQGMSMPQAPYQPFSAGQTPRAYSSLPQPTGFPSHALSPHSLMPSAQSPYNFSPNAQSPYSLPPNTQSPYSFSPNAQSPYSLSPHALSPHALAPHPLSSVQSFAPHSLPSAPQLSPFGQQFSPSASQFPTSFPMPFVGQSSQFTQNALPQLSKLFPQRAGYQLGARATPAVNLQNEVESSHEVRSPKSHISSLAQKSMVPPGSKINKFADNYDYEDSNKQGRSHGYSFDYPNSDSAESFNIPKYFLSDNEEPSSSQIDEADTKNVPTYTRSIQPNLKQAKPLKLNIGNIKIH